LFTKIPIRFILYIADIFRNHFLNMEDLDFCFEKASKLAKEAGEAALFYYHLEYEISDKGDNSPVTRADHASNDVIVEGLKKEFDYGILSEETDDDLTRLKKKRVWVVDPLDGTKDFIDKTGDFSIMVGLVEDGKPVLGIVYRPERDVMYYALAGGGAFKKVGESGPQRLKTSRRDRFEDMILLTSRFHASNTVIKAAGDLGIKNTLTKGSAGLKICSIAEGDADVNINPSNKTWEWDVAAADIILSEAGGKLTDVFENEFTYNKKDPRNSLGYIASNSWKHYDIIREVRKCYNS
jgi:3'(2'), 5'-bisphosphate nucleotidase